MLEHVCKFEEIVSQLNDAGCEISDNEIVIQLLIPLRC